MEDMNYEEMRSQMASLKAHLDKQEIVNDKLMREIMNSKSGVLRRNKRVGYAIGAFGVLLYASNALGGTHIFSPAFALVTCAVLIFCVAATYYIHRPVEKLNFMTDDLSTVARTMARFKKQYDDWLHYVTPVILVPWLAWACYEVGWKNAPGDLNPLMMIVAILIGGTIGGAIGYHFHRSTVNTAKSILKQIEEN